MQHATGISSLIQRRGPDVYQNEWDRSILNSLRPILVSFLLFLSQLLFATSIGVFTKRLCIDYACHVLGTGLLSRGETMA